MPRARQEDSGLIDLNALRAAGEHAAARTPIAVPRVPIYPLGAPVEAGPAATAAVPDATAPEALAPRDRSTSWRMTPALVGAGAALALVSVGLVAFAAQVRTFGRIQMADRGVGAVAAEVSPQVIDAPSGRTDPGAVHAIDVSSLPDARPEALDAGARVARARPVTAAVPRRTVPRGAAPARVATSPGAVEKAPAPKADGCTGDLMCAMERAVRVSR